MKYFITGGAGFVGSNLADVLIKDNEVVVYDNLSVGTKDRLEPHFKNPKFQFIKGDVLNKKFLTKSMAGCDFVIHMASNADISRSIETPSLDFDQGILATFNVLEAMRANGINKLFYNSGSGVYGDQGVIFTAENFGPLLPSSMYGASKLAAEGLISAFCEIYGFQAWILRPANLVGRKQTHGVGPAFIAKLKKNPKELEILGDGRQSKSYVHIDDFISAFNLVLKKGKAKINLYNLASNSYLDVTSIAKIAVSEMGLENVQFKYTGGRGGWKGDVPKVRMNSKKIQKLGWKPKLNSKEAFRKAIKELIVAK